jgi:hypothetical protein
MFPLLKGFFTPTRLPERSSQRRYCPSLRGYFYEMACVIAESARVLKRNAPLIMVNDNVRYAGISISVDLILSDFAKNLGFEIEKILVLPNGKGNSSQQMSEHGREVLRKCVYIWRKV